MYNYDFYDFLSPHCLAISLTFVEREYNIMEQDATVDDLVFIAKENDVVSEQVLKILVEVVPNPATRGEYTSVMMISFCRASFAYQYTHNYI